MLPRAASMRLAGVLARFTPPRRDDLPWVGAAYRLPVPKKWAVSSAVEHCFHTAGATGSIPVPPTNNQSLINKTGDKYDINTARSRKSFAELVSHPATAEHQG